MDTTHIVLDLGDLGTLIRVTGERIAELELLGLGRKSTNEFLVDAFLDKDPRTGTTCLPVIPANIALPFNNETNQCKDLALRTRHHEQTN